MPSPPPPPHAPLRITFSDGFEIDEARFELRRSSEPIHVQPKVLDLIVHLARHRDRVVTKEELFETVWRGIAVTEASLTQAVSLARRALDDSPTDQLVIRTVRNKGFQFVASCSEAKLAAVAVASRASVAEASTSPKPTQRNAQPAGPAITSLETAEDGSARSGASWTGAARRAEAEAPHLFAALDCEFPDEGGRSWSLADIDEVWVVRGSERRSQRHVDAMTRVLTVTVPGRFMSRKHARIVRTPVEWLVVDGDSRNGTFVNGERVDKKRPLRLNDTVECGRVLFRFTREPRFDGVALDLDGDLVAGADGSAGAAQLILPTVTPYVAALAQDLAKIATSNMSILLLGESGTGKSSVASALHRASGRKGPLVTVDGSGLGAASIADDTARTVLALASPSSSNEEVSTLLVENVERVPLAVLNAIKSVIDGSQDTRVIATSSRPLPDLAAQLPSDFLTRIAGFRCTLPPLRERHGDLGVLLASVRALKSGGGGPNNNPGTGGFELEVAAGRALLAHEWLGNLHELAHTLESAVVLSGGGPIKLAHLPVDVRTQRSKTL